ncbi:hypothetical protein SDC9_194063 [bioreactor metagenome]|uniref:Uncharacterized protein n=1 Tax=bioreactor metagenome TaxID=1076179 RepID=A0A645I589_9ZZZZ
MDDGTFSFVEVGQNVAQLDADADDLLPGKGVFRRVFVERGAVDIFTDDAGGIAVLKFVRKGGQAVETQGF